MTAARRAAYNPRKLIVVSLLVTVIILFLIFLIATAWGPRTHQASPDQAGAPTPQPTWTSYIPVTSQPCREAMDAADVAIEQAEDRYTSTLKAAQLGNDDNPGGAEKQIKIAQQAHEDLTKTIGAYMKKAKECKK